MSNLEVFGETDSGEKVHRVKIEGGGLTAHFLTYGTVLQDFRLEGHEPSLVLGFEQFPAYLTKSPYFGATAGRCANRIRDGHFEHQGKVYQLDRNFLGKHHLHGGAKSMGKRLWAIKTCAQDSVTFEIDLLDGEMGYPGNVKAAATFQLLENGTLDIQYRAEVDTPTLISFAHHSYFNLDGSETILDHELCVSARRFLPVDNELIPTGEQRQVEGTVFDFRTPKPIGKASNYCPVDHNFCLSKDRQKLREVASLSSPKSKVHMRCLTTEPGLQVYDGAKIDIDTPGLDGFKMSKHAGIALEPQVWPDATHHATFPSALRYPDEPYQQHTQYIFKKERS
jgi:aldose 1-epimerase